MQKHCMMPQTTGRVFSALIFRHAVALLLLTHSHGGRSQATDQPQPIVAMVGDDITLPCHLKPATDAVNEMLEWSRPDLNPRFVHMRRAGEDHLVNQNPSYRGRTSVSIDRLKHGDVSLNLYNVKLSDEEIYRCFIPRLNTQSSVQLVVLDADIEITKVSTGVLLECKCKGWNPEPELLWLDGEGNVLSAGPTETLRGPDDLYTVSSRVTVEKRHSNSFTCRVQHKNTNLSRETHVQVPDDFFMDSFSSSASTTIGLVVGIMVVLAVAFVVWKWRQNKIKTNTYHVDAETHRGAEKKKKNFMSNDPEQDHLMGETTREQLKKERETTTNQNEMEEENNSECLSEEARCSYRTEEETQTETAEGETSNIYTQRKGDIENHSVNTGTEEKTKSVSEETPAPTEAERQTHQEQPGETKCVNTEAQGLMDGDGQQEVRTGGEAKNETDKEENKEQTTNNEAAGQSPTQLNDTPAGRGTTKNLDQTGKSDGTPCPAERGQQEENRDRAHGGENTTPSPADGPTDHLPEAEGQSDLKKTNEDKDTNSANNNAAGQGPTVGERQQDHLPAGGQRKVTLEQTEGQTGKISEDTPCPEERGQQDNREWGDGGENTTNARTLALSPVDESPDAEGQSDLRKTNEDGDTKSTNNETAGQSPAVAERHQLQAEGERKCDDEKTLMSEEPEPPCSSKTETHPETSPERRHGEKDMTAREDMITDEARRAEEQTPAGDVQSDVDNTEEDKTELQTEGQTQVFKGQAETQEKEDGEERTRSTHDKTEHQAEVNEPTEQEQHVARGDLTDDEDKGQRENERTSGREETGLQDEKKTKKRPRKSGRNQDGAGEEEENNPNSNSLSDNSDPQILSGEGKKEQETEDRQQGDETPV